MPLAPVSNSVIFKKLFRDPDVLTVFLKDLTGLELDIRPEYIETEKRFTPPVGAVDIVLDIVVEDPTHRILIEMQRERYDYHYDRFLYYHQVATVELTRSYRDYRLGRTVYTIVWLTTRSNDPLYQHGLITTSLCSVTDRGEELSLYPHRLFFLNPFYRNDQTRARLDDWLQLVMESITNPQEPTLNYQRDIIRKASGLIAGDSVTPEERRIMFEETGYEIHLNLREAQGRAEGHAEGLEEGREAGKEERSRAIARAMLTEGMDEATIIRITGLTADEVARLSQEHHE